MRLRRGALRRAATGIAALLVALVIAEAARAATRYATTPAVEPDRCATAWVIRSHLESDASFEFFPEGEFPDGVTLFDLPEAALRRDARRATLEVLIERERLSEPFVLYLGRMVHDIEIRAWARPEAAPSAAVERRIMEAVLAQPDPSSALAACFAVLDGLESEFDGLER